MCSPVLSVYVGDEKLISRHCLDKTRTRWNDLLFLITDDRDFRLQTCTNGLVFRECKHIKNICEDVYFNKNSFHITLRQYCNCLFQAYFDTVKSNLLSIEEYKSLGFAASLVCTQCKELDQFNLSQLTESCNKCCQNADNNGDELKVSNFIYTVYYFVKRV